MEQRGEKLEALYEEEAEYVWNSLRRLNVPERDVEDLCQEVFLTAYQNLEDYDADRPVQPWLFGIAFRIASDYREKASHSREKLTDPDPPSESPEVVEKLNAEAARKLVQEALEYVDLERRAVFVLHEVDGHAMKDVAESLSIPLHTAYSRNRVAKEEFKEAVRSIVDEEESDD